MQVLLKSLRKVTQLIDFLKLKETWRSIFMYLIIGAQHTADNMYMIGCTILWHTTGSFYTVLRSIIDGKQLIVSCTIIVGAQNWQRTTDWVTLRPNIGCKHLPARRCPISGTQLSDYRLKCFVFWIHAAKGCKERFFTFSLVPVSRSACRSRSNYRIWKTSDSYQLSLLSLLLVGFGLKLQLG